MKLPAPELPVSNMTAATAAYASRMGFSVDWTSENYLAGISEEESKQ